MLPPKKLELSGERFVVSYKIIGSHNEAYQKALDICVEQTIEFPVDLIPEGDIKDSILGKIETFDMLADGVYIADISYAIEVTSDEITQLINVIFGNISLKPGIRVEKILLSNKLLNHFRGPRFGIKGVRDKLQVYNRPILCTALKPMGLSNEDLAILAYQFAKGGIDIIKDDHGLSDQPFSPFTERVEKCIDAIHKANRETGRQSIYVPNITAPDQKLIERAQFAKKRGAGGLMISPGIVGFDRMLAIVRDDNLSLPILYHPAFTGSYVIDPTHGISHYTLYGQFARLAGADVVIFPNYGGRFSFSQQDCLEIATGAKEPWGHIMPIFPAPAGGMRLENIHEMLNFYGEDFILLIGGDLHRHGPNLVENCQLFIKAVEH